MSGRVTDCKLLCLRVIIRALWAVKREAIAGVVAEDGFDAVEVFSGRADYGNAFGGEFFGCFAAVLRLHDQGDA